MHQTARAASRLEASCSKRRLLHAEPIAHAANGICCMGNRTFMQQRTPASARGQPECRKRRPMHRKRNHHAANAACCIAIQIFKKQKEFAAKSLQAPCSKSGLLHGWPATVILTASICKHNRKTKRPPKSAAFSFQWT